MSATQAVRSLLSKIDVENMPPEFGPEITPTVKRGNAVQNGIQALLETASAIPGISIAAGGAHVIYGFVKLIAGVALYSEDVPGGGRLIGSAAKSIGLGAAAVALGPIGNVLNAIFAAGDVVDTVNFVAK